MVKTSKPIQDAHNLITTNNTLNHLETLFRAFLVLCVGIDTNSLF
jgi:hypothetical protein